MRNTFVLLLLFFCFSLQAQTNASLSPAEKFIISLLTRDSSSSYTIYLPHQIKMGIPWTGHTYVIIAKEKKNSFFMVAGTHQVHKINPEDPFLPLVRIDSSAFYGDNYNCMGFLHQDTLYQYGGYGFWKNRDFFTRFVPVSGDWEFVQGSDALENLLTLTYLDRPNNTFYSFGHYVQNSFNSFGPEFKDTVYVYNLLSKKWKSLGRINPLHPKTIGKLINGVFVETPLGVLVRCEPSNFIMIDFAHNKVVPFKKTDLDNFEAIKRVNARRIQNNVTFDNLLFLNDSLYFMDGNQESLSVSAVKLDSSMLDYNAAITLYDPVSSIDANIYNMSFTTKKLLTILAVLLFLSALIFLLFIYQKRKKTIAEGENLEKEQIINSTDAINVFIGSLPEVEKELLKELVQYSLQDKKMPASIVNKLLGVTHKETDIQKARRSQAIMHINEQFTENLKIPGLLISRERDISDKRAFVYFIPEDKLKMIEPVWTDVGMTASGKR